MKLERQFMTDKLTVKRVYQSPATQVVKLGATTILAGSDMRTLQANETYGDGDTSSWSF